MMKKKMIYISATALIFGQTSCNNYLKEGAGDLLIPKTVEEYSPLLYGEGYPKGFDKDVAWHKLMTDDVEMGYLERDPEYGDSEKFDVLNGGEGKLAYAWDYNIEDKILDNNWDSRYENILGCNAVIDALPDMVYPAGEEGKYNYLAAQAYTLRAYHYFCLVNCYALPDVKKNPDQLGVIIRTTPQIQTTPRERSTIGEVYDLINSDIQKAEEYAAVCDPSSNKHLITPAGVWLLATRIALFQENWEEVIAMGKKFMNENSFILDLNTVPEDQLGSDVAESTVNGVIKPKFTMFNIAQNKEIVFTFGSNSGVYDYLSNSPMGGGFGFRTSYSGEGSLIRSYQVSDLRLLAFFQKNETTPGTGGDPDWTDYYYMCPIKYKNGKSIVNYRENWRTVEVFLNMAEAYAREAAGISQDAIDLVNRLRVCRIRRAGYVAKSVADFANKEALVRFIWDERRRELCFEESMRFWDMRRQGMPRQEHKFYSDKVNFETYVLEQGCENYVLAIPKSEMKNNLIITSNDRAVITPQ